MQEQDQDCNNKTNTKKTKTARPRLDYQDQDCKNKTKTVRATPKLQEQDEE